MAGFAVNPLVSKALMLGAVQVPEELDKLAEFVADFAPVNIMEIGAETGGTFYLWCHLATGIKISLDFPSGASGSGRFAGKEALAERTAEFRRWSANVRVVIGDSHLRATWDDVNDILHGEKLDFLFIDGDHSYQGVKLDWEDYRGFVRPGGYVAFHDIKDTEHHRRVGCDVARFWAELPGAKREFCTDMHWGGIGLIRI
jgi:hypothetical protein